MKEVRPTEDLFVSDEFVEKLETYAKGLTDARGSALQIRSFNHANKFGIEVCDPDWHADADYPSATFTPDGKVEYGGPRSVLVGRVVLRALGLGLGWATAEQHQAIGRTRRKGQSIPGEGFDYRSVELDTLAQTFASDVAPWPPLLSTLNWPEVPKPPKEDPMPESTPKPKSREECHEFLGKHGCHATLSWLTSATALTYELIFSTGPHYRRCTFHQEVDGVYRAACEGALHPSEQSICAQFCTFLGVSTSDEKIIAGCEAAGLKVVRYFFAWGFSVWPRDSAHVSDRGSINLGSTGSTGSGIGYSPEQIVDLFRLQQIVRRHSDVPEMDPVQQRPSDGQCRSFLSGRGLVDFKWSRGDHDHHVIGHLTKDISIDRWTSRGHSFTSSMDDQTFIALRSALTWHDNWQDQRIQTVIDRVSCHYDPETLQFSMYGMHFSSVVNFITADRAISAQELEAAVKLQNTIFEVFKA